jgi:TfoX/Sxy family transcriptional regulator of competence genes
MASGRLEGALDGCSVGYSRAMAYDQRLADRVGDLMHARPGVVERRMFGGLGFMLNGNMACAVLSSGGLLVRVDPEEVPAALRLPHVAEFGRPGVKAMKGFVAVEPAGYADEAALAEWVERGCARAMELPAK